MSDDYLEGLCQCEKVAEVILEIIEERINSGPDLEEPGGDYDYDWVPTRLGKLVERLTQELEIAINGVDF